MLRHIHTRHMLTNDSSLEKKEDKIQLILQRFELKSIISKTFQNLPTWSLISMREEKKSVMV